MIASVKGVVCAGSIVVDVGKIIEAYPQLDHITTIEDDIARAILDDYYDLPDSAGAEADELERRLSAKGLQFVGTPGSTATQAHRASP